MKLRSHKSLLNKINMEKIVNILQFLVNGGWPRECKNRFPTEYEYLRKEIKKFNDANLTDFGVQDVMYDLGGDYSVKNNPADKKLIKPLLAIIEEHGSLKGLPELDPELYKQVNQRAKDYGIGIKRYVKELQFHYPAKMQREELLSEIVGLSDENGVVAPEKLTEDLNYKLSEAAKYDKTKKQHVLIGSSKPKVHLGGEQFMEMDGGEYHRLLMLKLDNAFRPNGEQGQISINATMLKEKGLYNLFRHAREALGLATSMTMADFINKYMQGLDFLQKYVYFGYETYRNISRENKNGEITRARVTLKDYNSVKE